MFKVKFVHSPTKVEVVGYSSISGKEDDFERIQASIYLASIEPSVKFKTFYRKLSESQIEKTIDYIMEEDLNQLRHTWVSFTTNCTRIATIDEEAEHHSYTEKSQRYTLTAPKSHIPVGVEGELFKKIFKPAVQSSFDLYYSMDAKGVDLENARDILSLSAMTSVVSTRSTYDELFHIASCIRGDKPKEIQTIGRRQYGILRSMAPNIFDEEEEILKKFNARKDFASIRYKNSNIDEILTMFRKRNSGDPFSRSDLVDVTVTPIKPGFIPAVAARTTRVTEDFATLKRNYEIGKTTDEELGKTLQNVIDSGHTSVAEHDYYIIQSTITNSLAHQLVRHRHIWDTYTPLIEAGKNLKFVKHRSVRKKGFAEKFSRVIKKLKEGFDELMAAGVKEAYYILPNATLIDVYVTTNAVELLHIIRRRVCKLAQEPIRLRFAIPLWKKLKANNPAIFANSGPDCMTNTCREKWPCENPYRKSFENNP